MRIALGFAIAFVTGCALGYLAARLPGLRTFLKPAVLAVKSAPVVCVIALLLVAVGSNATTAIVVGLVVFPQFYHAVMEAVLSRHSEVDKVLDVFGVPRLRRALCVELVAFGTAIRAATRTAAGLAWKSGVAAEIIGLPGISIGEGVYLAKISLDSASIIAWTATVILASWLSEKLLLLLVDAGVKLPRRWLAARVRKATTSPDAKPDAAIMPRPCAIDIDALERDYGTDGPRLRYENLSVPAGGRVCVMAPSGAGKTTLLSMLAGIDRPDAGKIAGVAPGHDALSVVLQDCTLVPWASALENVALVAGDDAEIRRGLRLCRAMLDEEALGKPASALSGGMARRAELARALAHPPPSSSSTSPSPDSTRPPRNAACGSWMRSWPGAPSSSPPTTRTMRRRWARRSCGCRSALLTLCYISGGISTSEYDDNAPGLPYTLGTSFAKKRAGMR
ncbi:MAG: ATP-binding cassette domain-containing protein [Coriobacteriales bacterium]